MSCTRRCYDRPTLDRFARHYQTGELLPDDLFQKLVAARTFRHAPTPDPFMLLISRVYGSVGVALCEGSSQQSCKRFDRSALNRRWMVRLRRAEQCCARCTAAKDLQLHVCYQSAPARSMGNTVLPQEPLHLGLHMTALH